MHDYVWVLSRCEYGEGGTVIGVYKAPKTVFDAYPGNWEWDEYDYCSCELDSPDYYELRRLIIG